MASEVGFEEQMPLQWLHIQKGTLTMILSIDKYIQLKHLFKLAKCNSPKSFPILNWVLTP